MRASSPLLFAVALLLGPAAAAQTTAPALVWEAATDAASVTYSSDGAFVAVAGIIRLGTYTYGRLDVLAAADGAEVAHRQSHTAASILGRTNRVSLSQDEQRLVSANGGIRCTAFQGCHAERPGVFTWTFPELQPLEGRTDQPPAPSVAYAPDGQQVAVAYRYDNLGRVRIHSSESLDEVHVLSGHGQTASDVAYSPDGSRLASVGNDGMLRVWDAETGSLLFYAHHGGIATGGLPISVAFSPDGARIATGGDGTNIRVRVWDAETGGMLLDLDGQLAEGAQGEARVAFSPNSHYLVGIFNQFPPGAQPRQGAIRFWDATTGTIVNEYADMGPPPYGGGIRSIAFSDSENHRFAYVVGEIGVVKLAETDLDLRQADTPVGTEPGRVAQVAVEVFPNPTSGGARLVLEVPVTQSVRVEVSDLLGRRVAVVHNGELAGGVRHQLTLETRGLVDGVYLVRLIGETFDDARRLTITR